MTDFDFSYPGLIDIRSPRYDNEARWNISLGVVRHGRPWSGVEELNVTESDEDGLPDQPIASAKWQFSRTPDFLCIALELVSPTTITIVDAAAWRIAVPAVNSFPLDLGLWYHRLLITDQATVEDQYLSGTVTVVE